MFITRNALAKILLLSTLPSTALLACGGEPQDATPGSEISAPGKADETTTGKHYEAMNHEIFIDKITPYTGSHALHALVVFVKTLNDRLDGPIAEVGFRDKRTGEAYGGSKLDRDWANDKLSAFAGSDNYWSIDLYLSSDFSWQTYEGVFYVKTTSGTFYWAKAQDHQNFVFDTHAWSRIMDIKGNPYNYSPSESEGVPTQQPGMEYWNWNQSR